MKKLLSRRFTILLAITAVIYNSWPLGYLADSYTARYGLPSDLEDPHRPYAWLFIGGDILTALIMIGLCAYLIRKLKSTHIKVIWSCLCLGILLFGFFTGFGAAAPDHCHGKLALCVNVFNKNLSLDTLESSAAGLGLVIALLSSAALAHFLEGYNKLVSWIIFAVWFSVGSLLTRNVLQGQSIHTIEQLFLVLCGIGLISIGFNIDKYLAQT